jgi:hypothetical protein
MPALANEFGRLVGALHDKSPYLLAIISKHLYFQIHITPYWEAGAVPSRRDCLTVRNWGGL